MAAGRIPSASGQCFFHMKKETSVSFSTWIHVTESYLHTAYEYAAANAVAAVAKGNLCFVLTYIYKYNMVYDIWPKINKRNKEQIDMVQIPSIGFTYLEKHVCDSVLISFSVLRIFCSFVVWWETHIS